MKIDELVDKIKAIDGVLDAQKQASVPMIDGRTLTVIRIYTETEKPPDLGIHVSDGIRARVVNR